MQLVQLSTATDFANFLPTILIARSVSPVFLSNFVPVDDVDQFVPNRVIHAIQIRIVWRPTILVNQ